MSPNPCASIRHINVSVPFGMIEEACQKALGIPPNNGDRMGVGTTKNAALGTALAFHYQVLIGLDRCFEMQSGQSIFIEKDGDVSLVGGEGSSFQLEAKKYGDFLTDHHENFWKTLKNWLAREFPHEKYASLVLHTTQPFGSTSSLNEWNKKSADDRVLILRAIFSQRSEAELSSEKPSSIVALQQAVMGAEAERLKAVLAKVVIYTDAENEDELHEKISNRILGIPNNNKNRFVQALVGFLYGQATKLSWEIAKADFDACYEDLNSTYCRREFTFPPFFGHEASPSEIEEHGDALFIKKINDIEHHDVIPDAIGNWLELQNSLSAQLDEYPLYRQKTEQYRNELVKRFKLKHSTAKIRCKDNIPDSKIFYNETMTETPLHMGQDAPPLAYRNGLVHDAMDDEELNLNWWVGP
jgi:hypothetical protein